MNPFEFASKTLLLYSLRRKIERIDLSSLTDDVFDKVLAGLSATDMCVEGSPFTGKYVLKSGASSSFCSMLESEVAPAFPRVKQLMAYLNALQDGDVFRIVSEDAPTMNKQLAVLKTKGLETGEDEIAIHKSYLLKWGALSTGYRHFAYGYDGIRTSVGEGNKAKRVCRFCGRKMPEVTFKDVAHAVSEGLGNKMLFCNEECEKCNNRLSKLESNLTHYLDIRRAMGGILTKTDGMVPSVDGKGFVIRGNENNQAILYIEDDGLLKGKDLSQPNVVKLETTETVTHQGIYKSLCKIVIDLLPTDEMAHFGETIGWINGSVLDNELPPYMATYDRESVSQPTVDLFLSRHSGAEPYCTAIVHILDAVFLFVLPEVDVDKGRFKSFDAIIDHLAKFISPYGGQWQVEDASEFTLASPWSMWEVLPGDPRVQVRPKTDPVFMRYQKPKKDVEEEVFPSFSPKGISVEAISNVLFERRSSFPVTTEDLLQVSVNYRKMVCLLDRGTSTARFVFDINFSDSANRLSYFDFSFEAMVKFEDFDAYIKIGDYFCIDYHLRDYMCEIVMAAADEKLQGFTKGTDLAPVTLKKTMDRRTVRQLYYHVSLGDGRYLAVSDAKLHNL